MKNEQQGNYLNGAVLILNGRYQDAIIPLKPGESLVVGRDGNECQLVLEAPWISRRHVSILFDAASNKYVVVDSSENGTFIKDGERLQKGIECVLNPGTVLTIGEDGVLLKLV